MQVNAVNSFACLYSSLGEDHMQLLVFVTDNGTPDGTGPLLFVKDHPLTALPGNPRSLEWRYFATIPQGDKMILDQGAEAQVRLQSEGFYIASRLV